MDSELVGLHMKDILRDELFTLCRNWLALGKAVSELVGLHMKDILRDELFTLCRNWLALGKAVCPGSARP